MGLLDRILILWLGTFRYRWSRLRRSLFEGRYLSVELPPVTSLEDIEVCLKKVVWTLDGPLHLFDSISYPQSVWAKKKDDCDGFAVLAAKLLDRWSPASNPVLVTAIVRPVRRSHTICAFSSNGVIWFFDNSRLRREDCQTYDDLIVKITSGVERLICWDVVKPDTLETLGFYVT